MANAKLNQARSEARRRREEKKENEKKQRAQEKNEAKKKAEKKAAEARTWIDEHLYPLIEEKLTEGQTNYSNGKTQVTLRSTDGGPGRVEFPPRLAEAIYKLVNEEEEEVTATLGTRESTSQDFGSVTHYTITLSFAY